MFTLILSLWIHCIETHIAGSTCPKRESSIYIGGFWMEDYISCWLYKLKYTLVWHSLKPECYSACTKVLESGLGSHFFLYFLPKSPYLPHWIVFYLKSLKQDSNVCKHWLQILSIIWVPCSLQPPRAKLTSKISPPVNHTNTTPLFISIQVYLPISGNQFIRWLIRHYIPTICYTAQLINVATAPTYLECYANCIARVSSVTKAFLAFLMSAHCIVQIERIFEKKHIFNHRNTIMSNQYPCFAPLIIKRSAPQGCTPFQIFRYFYRHLYVLLTQKRNWEEKTIPRNSMAILLLVLVPWDYTCILYTLYTSALSTHYRV